MKRIYIAIPFLIISISLCIFEQKTINDVYSTTSVMINEAVEYTNADDIDYDKIYSISVVLKDYWIKKYPYLTSMVEHGIVDDVKFYIDQLPDLARTKNGTIREALNCAKNQLDTLYEAEKIHTHNIL